MPLPTDRNMAWPPKSWEPFAADIREADAWYSGDKGKLGAVYGSTTAGQRSDGRFWARRAKDTTSDRERLHVPAAANVATVSADLLFGRDISFEVPELPDLEGPLAGLLDEGALDVKILEAAELASGLGGVYLRPMLDPTLSDRPFMAVAHADTAVPEFRWGELSAVTFWSILPQDDDKHVWRHLERYEPGVILHGLYVGTATELGQRLPLAAHPVTAGLDVNDDGAHILDDGVGLACSYVPNVRPNRKHRAQPVGRSDCAGAEDSMHAFDEAWSSWMRDLRLGQARIIAPQDYFNRRGGRGGGAEFDVDQEVFTRLDIPVESTSTITTVEFKLRVEEHERTCMAHFEQIIGAAGYSPQSFGLQGDGAAITATEVNAKEGRSDQTTAKKRRYWRRGLERTVRQLLIFDGVADPPPVRLVWPGVDQDLREMASTLNLINLARAASIETRVKMLHPDWEEVEVQAEAERIKAEEGVGMVDPSGGLPL